MKIIPCVPLDVYLFWHNSFFSSIKMKENIDNLKKNNPEFTFHLYDDDLARNFIKKHFHNDILLAYDTLIPYSYKSDLWRFCVLYQNGGIYLDVKLTCVNNFKFINLVSNECFPTDINYNNNYNFSENEYVFTGFLISKKNNSSLLNCINQIVDNVKNLFYGKNSLEPTGPGVLGKFFSDEFKKSNPLRRYVNYDPNQGEIGDGVAFHNKVILDKYPGYNSDYTTPFNHYSYDWSIKNIYNLNLNIKLDFDNSIIFVTAFKDINRESFLHFSRSVDTYLMYFNNLAINIDYKIIIYIEDTIYKKLDLSIYKKNIIFKNLAHVDTFYNKYIQNEKIIINDEKFKSKIPSHRLNVNLETFSADYNMILHSKVNFLTHTKNIYPDYKYYSWIDFGFIRDTINIPKNLDFNKFQEKIIFQQLIPMPNKDLNSNEVLTLDDVFLAGSAFIIHNSLVHIVEKLYENIIIDWQKNYICDDDQSAFLQIYFKNKELFQLIYHEKWFHLFNCLQN